MVLFMDPSGQTEIPVLQALSWNHFRISVTDTKAVAIMEVTILVGYVESTAKLESLFTV